MLKIIIIRSSLCNHLIDSNSQLEDMGGILFDDFIYFSDYCSINFSIFSLFNPDLILIFPIFSFSGFLLIFFISNLLYFSVKKFFTVFFVDIIFGLGFTFFLELLIFLYLEDPTFP